jgi:colanic acid biosynthesis glycosyl transferase WcaI
MKILVASINYYPDHSGIALYSTDLAVYLAEQGHEVSVVTGFPYYPNWRKRAEDQGRLFRKERYRETTVHRGYLYVPARVTTARRLIHEATFGVFALFNWLRIGRQDRIVVLSPPLILGLLGIVFKFLWKSKLIFHIQDFQLDAALSLGMMRANPVVRVLRYLERWIYSRSDLIATISEGMFEHLLKRGLSRDKLGLFYNWIDLREFGRPRTAGKFLSKFPMFQGKTLVAYAGNIGIKQGLEVILKIAERSAGNSNLHFIIIGDGAYKAKLMEAAHKNPRSNLTFLPFMPTAEYYDMLTDVDIVFVSQKSGCGDIFFPSKMLGIMALAKPVSVVADPASELAKVIEKAGCGLVASPAEDNKMYENILTLARSKELRKQLGEQGARWVKCYDRECILTQFMAAICA